MSDTPDYTDDGLLYFPDGPDDFYVEQTEPNFTIDTDGVKHIHVADQSEVTKYLIVNNKVTIENPLPF